MKFEDLIHNIELNEQKNTPAEFEGSEGNKLAQEIEKTIKKTFPKSFPYQHRQDSLLNSIYISVNLSLT